MLLKLPSDYVRVKKVSKTDAVDEEIPNFTWISE